MRGTLSVALAFVVACGGPTAAPSTSAPASGGVAAPTPASVTPTSRATAAATTSPVLRIALTDVRSAERFTLGGFAGKTVIVEGMAVW
ncbi:MAG TPA: hypothetical protein VGS01_13850 [Candidatus Limnocylindria bacterium]|nr:hypothetical protein [Candidatus Limnocylindria bacterium]